MNTKQSGELKQLKEIKFIGCQAGIACLLFLLTCLPGNSHAINDTTLFRIKVLQDTVYAGDTVDVDLYLGDEGLLGILNILTEFEMEIATDTSLIVQDKIEFKLDSASLATFFGTLFSNLSIIQLIDPILGTINIKASSPTLSNGNARVGRGKYIVQDNAAGRQYMRFDYTKTVSKGLLGLGNPVKIIEDSVYIAEREIPTAIKFPTNTKIKIFPNPATDRIHIEGGPIEQYKLMNVVGKLMRSGSITTTDTAQLMIDELAPGIYYLVVQEEKYWTSYKIIKN